MRRARPFLPLCAALAAAGAWHGAACAQSLPPNPPDCITAAAAYHQVSPYVLRAIAWQESRMRPNAINRNANGSVDYGALQINSIHLPMLRRYGIDAQQLMDPCVSAYVGAWLLRQQIDRYGSTWRAVGGYHSQTPELNVKYASGVIRTLRGWGIDVTR